MNCFGFVVWEGLGFRVWVCGLGGFRVSGFGLVA